MMLSQEPMGSYAYIEDGISDIKGVGPGRPWRGNARCGAMSSANMDPRNGRSWRPNAGGAQELISVYAASSVVGSLMSPDSVILCNSWLWKDVKLWWEINTRVL